ncbi:MAG: ABC transporter permease [Planctomycetes bacterium]|nr:ABC transporter permease [Planctomycetota bacterium]
MASPPPSRGPIVAAGARLLDLAEYLGGMTLLLGEALRWIGMGLVGRPRRLDVAAVAAQVVRLGVRATGIVLMVQFFVGMILALQMAPPLEPFGSLAMIADIIGFGFMRELGPLLAAVVLSGFAGASIAAEIGTMAVSEELEALRTHAIRPVRYLVVPRLLATIVAMVALTVLSDLAGCAGGYASAVLVLGPEASQGYWDRIAASVRLLDFTTGLVKAGVFGLVLGLLACHEGLKVRDGAAGVGRATTMTVVYTIVSLVVVDCIFTVLFYVYEL